MTARLIVLALDGVPPATLFSDEISRRMPNVSALRRRGVSAPLLSTLPPITVPAWACAMTARDPGELGLYGFRDRTDASYGSMAMATSASVDAEAVWDLVGAAGGRSIVIGLPPGFPPRRIAGEWIGCFLTPSLASAYTWPEDLRTEIADVVGEYVFDVEGFRDTPREELLERLLTMTRRRWRLAEHLLGTRDVDLFVLHEIGFDRIHHGFWKDHDPAHRKHDPGGPFRSAVADYYAMVDERIGALLALSPRADVVLLSDHGCKRMDGGIRINQWLIDGGYLRLRRVPDEPGPFREADVDWDHTRAWAAGGYYGRLWLNMRGREPSGTVASADASRLLDEIAEGAKAIRDDRGAAIPTRAFRPAEVYREVRGLAPDLMLYFGDLYWRSVASVGGRGWVTLENDTGPDDANHSEDGVLVVARAEGPVVLDGSRPPSILRIAPTLASLLGLARPRGWGEGLLRA